MKRGTCKNCDRPDIGLVSGGLCSVCYAAGRRLNGEEKQRALAEAKKRIRIKTLRAAERKRTTEDTKTPGAQKTISTGDPEEKTLSISFDGPDLKVYDALKAFACANRRESIQAEVICILEDHLFGRRVPSSYKGII